MSVGTGYRRDGPWNSAIVPGRVSATVIELRAGRLPDPISRLRYLRRATVAGSKRYRRWTRGAGLALVLIPFVPSREVAWAPRLENSHSAPPSVWLVEAAPDHETYSNGLRIETRYTIETQPRSYGVFDRNRPDSEALQWRTEPAGIVYHATESELAPFEPEQNARIQRIDESLLDYIRFRQSYHFVIDRFGRVYRVVAEQDSADHAGHSIWADQRQVYCNLNAAFLGIAFEARTDGGSKSPVTEAQLQAGRVLTDMLRFRYRIPGDNCITHAQVSVNPHNMEIGYHTDWARQFPFAAMGLTDNYRLPVASTLLFGFGYSHAFLRATNGTRWQGLVYAEETMQEQAAARGLSPAEYMRLLQERYRMKMGALRRALALEENSNERE
ncbi:MAG: peptidoglycan recognition family protein [Bryobacteraceae bacterium]